MVRSHPDHAGSRSAPVCCSRGTPTGRSLWHSPGHIPFLNSCNGKRHCLRSPEGSKEVSAPLFRRNKMLLLRSPGQNPAVQCCEVPCSGKKLSSQSAVYVAEDRLPPDSGRNQKSPPGSPCICSRKKIPLFSVCCTPGNTVHRSSQDCPAVLLPSDAGSLRMLFFWSLSVYPVSETGIPQMPACRSRDRQREAIHCVPCHY